jgi:uncharacterized membrane protein HdeD (DUF308 family)
MPALPLAEWRDFYVMIGTASGAIVGATFVVASLASDTKDRMVAGFRGFITPSAVHLGSVLVGSAILTAPTLTPLALAVLLGFGAIAGAIYGIVVAFRVRSFKIDLSDRLFYVVLPIFAYAGLAASSFLCRSGGELGFDILAASLVLLLITGMRNVWDMAAFMITRDRSS